MRCTGVTPARSPVAPGDLTAVAHQKGPIPILQGHSGKLHLSLVIKSARNLIFFSCFSLAGKYDLRLSQVSLINIQKEDKQTKEAGRKEED